MTIALSGYKITEEIHCGTTTIIYRGFKEPEQTKAIVKILKADYPSLEDITRLRHEYKILQGLNIKGIIRPLDLALIKIE